MEASRLLLIGCGAMGSAMLSGWLKTTSFQGGIYVVSPHRARVEPFLQDPRVRYFFSPTDISDAPDVIVCAVKPTLIESVLPAYAALMTQETLFLSVAAGKTLGTYERLLGAQGCLVRVMPNLPSAIGQGVSLVVPKTALTPAQSTQVNACLAPLGDVVFLENEDMLDRVATLTGCGPAYVFYFVEALAHAGQALGLSQDQAMDFAKKTVVGSAQYMVAFSQGVTQLRQNVTSSGGMTQAALAVLMQDRVLSDLLVRALKVAYERVQEMK